MNQILGALVTATTLLAGGAALALVDGEPGTCSPTCRMGYMCRAGRCVSLCNPPCGTGEHCVKGDCEPVPRKGAPRRDNYLGVMGAVEVGLNGSAKTLGEVRIELGGRYTSFQIGPAFGTDLTAVRAAILGHVPFQPAPRIPFYLVPTVSLGYTFGWISDAPGQVQSRHIQDIFIVPGLRLRYDVLPRLALMADLIQIQINFVRLYSSTTEDVHRTEFVPVTWTFALGMAFLY